MSGYDTCAPPSVSHAQHRVNKLRQLKNGVDSFQMKTVEDAEKNGTRASLPGEKKVGSGI